MVLSNQDPMLAQIRIHNQTSRCFVRFAEGLLALRDMQCPGEVSNAFDEMPAKPNTSMYWHTLAAGSPSVPFAWEHTNYDIAVHTGFLIAPSAGDKAGQQEAGTNSSVFVQLAQVVSLRIFCCGESVQCDVDVDPARVGRRKFIRLPGSQPDIVVSTLYEPMLGAVVSNVVLCSF